jgi:hypothetical protein
MGLAGQMIFLFFEENKLRRGGGERLSTKNKKLLSPFLPFVCLLQRIKKTETQGTQEKFFDLNKLC